jgi:hypothetical protein
MTKPIKKFSAGLITASVFENEYENKEKKKISILSVQLQRAYKKDDEWQYTSQYSRDEIPKAIFCLQMAYEYILTKPQDSE